MKTALNSPQSPRTGVRWAPALLLLALGLGMVAPAQADRGWRGHPGGRVGYGWGGYHGYGWGGGAYGAYGSYGYYGALPAFATLLTIGALTYWVADGIYYRAVPNGGYEVVPAPAGAVPPAAAAVASSNRVFIYPRNAQSREQQATDEYQCHQWAVDQTGFDPSLGSAAGPADQESRQNYRRAQLACLDGRGYTVK